MRATPVSKTWRIQVLVDKEGYLHGDDISPEDKEEISRIVAQDGDEVDDLFDRLNAAAPEGYYLFRCASGRWGRLWLLAV